MFSLWGNNNVGWIHNDGVNGAGTMLTITSMLNAILVPRLARGRKYLI